MKQEDAMKPVTVQKQRYSCQDRNISQPQSLEASLHKTNVTHQNEIFFFPFILENGMFKAHFPHQQEKKAHLANANLS